MRTLKVFIEYIRRMETDLGDKDDMRSSPQAPGGYYEDELPPLERENTQQWYPQAPQPQMMYMPPTQTQATSDKKDIFADIDKTTYIIAFVVFILGFFMGKTMQPVILRNV